MKPTDEITVKITLAELAKAYVLLGNCVHDRKHSKLYYTAYKVFGGANLSSEGERWVGIPANRAFDFGEGQMEHILHFFPEERKREDMIQELKETIAKAQQQLEELER